MCYRRGVAFSHALTNAFRIVLVTGQVALDIEIIGRELEQMYGVLNEDNLKLN